MNLFSHFTPTFYQIYSLIIYFIRCDPGPTTPSSIQLNLFSFPIRCLIVLQIKHFHGKTKKIDYEGSKTFAIKLAQLAIEDSTETKSNRTFCKFRSTEFQIFRFKKIQFVKNHRFVPPNKLQSF
jgi:hypothetical protein